MRQDEHPACDPVVFRDRAAGHACVTRSTARSEQTIEGDDGRTHPVIDVEIASESHPFRTGRARTVDTEGRIARFESLHGEADAGDAP
ncbi:type B 50S ribosomal protein L31 [Streptomyces sp. NPDC001135]